MTLVLQEGRSLLTHTAGGVHMEEVPSLERTSLRSVSCYYMLEIDSPHFKTIGVL